MGGLGSALYSNDLREVEFRSVDKQSKTQGAIAVTLTTSGVPISFWVDDCRLLTCGSLDCALVFSNTRSVGRSPNRIAPQTINLLTYSSNSIVPPLPWDSSRAPYSTLRQPPLY